MLIPSYRHAHACKTGIPVHIEIIFLGGRIVPSAFKGRFKCISEVNSFLHLNGCLLRSQLGNGELRAMPEKTITSITV